MMSKRFYVIATGQAQANLPPILTLGSHSDEVVWIETPLARTAKRPFSRVSRRILAKRGFVSEQICLDADMPHPEDLRRKLTDDMRAHIGREPVFVITGGPKHLVLGMYDAARDSGGKIAYMDVHATSVSVLAPPYGVFEEVAIKNALTYAEWLALAGYCLQGGKRPQQIWPGQVSFAPARFDRFAADEAFQRALFTIHHEKARAKQKNEPWRPLKLAAHALQTLKEDGWINHNFDPGNPDVTLEGPPLGTRFEQAVALRLRTFLSANPDLARIVSTVHMNTAISSETKPNEPLAELDLAILLTNGSLIVIDCKCGRKPTQGELFANLGRLSEAGAAGASLHLCLPMFPKLLGDKAFLYLYDCYHQVSELYKVSRRFEFLFYTELMSAEPTLCEYQKESIQVVPFEKSVRSMLSRYIRQQSGCGEAAGR